MESLNKGDIKSLMHENFKVLYESSFKKKIIMFFVIVLKIFTMIQQHVSFLICTPRVDIAGPFSVKLPQMEANLS